MQVGNGNFAFGADVTGLQTFLPYGTLSSWGWHSSPLPANTSPSDFTGLDWWTHGRLVNYNMPNPDEAEISQWLIANPHRINLGRIGFSFNKGFDNVTEEDLGDKSQELDIYRGILKSSFSIDGYKATVWTSVDPSSDTIAVRLRSELLRQGGIALFFDFPYATGENKFDAPFVGDWDSIANHTTELHFIKGSRRASIKHTLDNTTYYTSLKWSGSDASIIRLDNSHKYILQPNEDHMHEFEITATFAKESLSQALPLSVDAVMTRSEQSWRDYWENGAFVDLMATGNKTAVEIQRRVVLSQYLLAVNGAGDDPPQESGLVNNGWYGKFHMEMYLWHAAHWTLWGHSSLLERSIDVYKRFLPSSLTRAKDQGYTGARWGKMSDPSGRSAPGGINAILIWQQPHIFYFAETEYQSFHSNAGRERDEVLQKWDHLLTESANFMASYSFWNDSTNVYDLGPPMYPVSENTPPNSTINPTFELAYWRFGLSTAISWKERLGQPAPRSWIHVLENLASLPTVETSTSSGDRVLTYTLYEGIPNMWADPETVTDHPALTGIYGLLPPTTTNITIVEATAEKVAQTWNFTDCWGWDFPMLAMNAARLGDVDAAVRYLVHENFSFDDVGMPIATRAPTPYFPGSAGLLLAVGMMAGGWDAANHSNTQRKAPGFPVNWEVQVEGFVKML